LHGNLSLGVDGIADDYSCSVSELVVPKGG
jgi:hypothetical protein